MPREYIPVTPALITWARMRAGYTLDAAKEKFPKIAEWEVEESSPTYSQLEQLADAFKVPIAVFFFPSPPSVPPIEETFRTISDLAITQLPPRIRLLLRKAKAFQMALNDLNGGRNPASRLITQDLSFPTTVSSKQMADAVREYLGVSVDEQATWTSRDEALEQWRKSFVESGVYVFKDQFRIEGFAGFCLTDDVFPIIYVNNTSPKSRQIFTLFHELGHLLFHTSGLDPQGNDQLQARSTADARRIEVLCNKFAGVFLVPQQALATALRDFTDLTSESIGELADYFNVSQLVIYRRLLDTKIITQAAYEQAHAAASAPPPQNTSSGGNPYYSKLAYLGRPFVATALSQYRQNRITAEQAADYLDVKPKNLDKLEEYFLRGVNT